MSFTTPKSSKSAGQERQTLHQVQISNMADPKKQILQFKSPTFSMQVDNSFKRESVFINQSNDPSHKVDAPSNALQLVQKTDKGKARAFHQRLLMTEERR